MMAVVKTIFLSLATLGLAVPVMEKAASAAPDTGRPARGVVLEVRVDESIVGADELHRWVEEAARQELSRLSDESRHRGTARIEVGGALYDYKVTLTALRDGAQLGAPSSWSCECSTEELLDRLHEELPGITGLLAVEEELPAPAPSPEPVVEAPVTLDDEGQGRRGLGAAGAAGVALMTIGGTGVATGAAFMIVGAQDLPTEEGVLRSRDFSTPGIAIVAGSGGLLVTGVLLFALRKRIDVGDGPAELSFAPKIDGAGGGQLTIRGRF